MRRDAQQALEGLDTIHRYTRQLRRWVEQTPRWAAEEDYDALHQAVLEAGVTLGRCYQRWHAAGREDSYPAIIPHVGGATEDVSLADELPGSTRSADSERSVGGAIPPTPDPAIRPEVSEGTPAFVGSRTHGRGDHTEAVPSETSDPASEPDMMLRHADGRPYMDVRDYYGASNQERKP